MTWTDERITAMCELWQAGKTGSEIASELGGHLTKNSELAQ